MVLNGQLKATQHCMRLKYHLRQILLIAACVGVYSYSQAQTLPVDTLKTDSLHKKPAQPVDSQAGHYDIGDLVQHIFRPKQKPDSLQKRSGITIIPNVAANPSIGAQIGIKAVAGRRLGTDPNTIMSIAATTVAITTKGIIFSYLTHNIYTPGNKWNFQGNLVAAKTVTPDYGQGIGYAPATDNPADLVLANPQRKARALHSFYFNFREKVYKEVKKGLFVGGGVSFDVRRHIDEGTEANNATPFKIFSDRYGFARDSYSANGLLFNVQYTTRDNLNRAYKGIYIDAGFRANQHWMGSSKNALQFTTDVRKYVSLSATRPEHVIAFWNWGSYLLSGAVPYLELPGTAKDPGSRSGRGYTIGYFNGTQFNYSEVEYRFPITRNKFLSGVAFVNAQTANDVAGTKLFKHWQPGYGGGLRVLFNKATRTNLCLDYAWGRYGARGFFLGLNEAF
jgi:hypothetical protein